MERHAVQLEMMTFLKGDYESFLKIEKKLKTKKQRILLVDGI
jgi:hypothetical protein